LTFRKNFIESSDQSHRVHDGNLVISFMLKIIHFGQIRL